MNNDEKRSHRPECVRAALIAGLLLVAVLIELLRLEIIPLRNTTIGAKLFRFLFESFDAAFGVADILILSSLIAVLVVQIVFVLYFSSRDEEDFSNRQATLDERVNHLSEDSSKLAQHMQETREYVWEERTRTQTICHETEIKLLEEARRLDSSWRDNQELYESNNRNLRKILKKTPFKIWRATTTDRDADATGEDGEGT